MDHYSSSDYDASIQEESEDSNNSDVDNEDKSVQKVNAVPPLSSKKEKARNVRSARQQLKTDLKKRNTGVGLGNIDIHSDTAASKTRNRKITFQDDVTVQDDLLESKENPSSKGDDDDQWDDDAVEEVNTSEARDRVLKQRASERETKRSEVLLFKKQRRRSVTKSSATVPEKPLLAQVNSDDDDSEKDEDLDEGFLAMVDTQRKKEKLQKQAEKETKKKRGRHTTFVSDGTASGFDPVPVDENIQVVVIGDDDHEAKNFRRAISCNLGTTPSKAAMVFSRSTLISGEGNSAKKTKKQLAKPRMKWEGKRTLKKETHWKRSKKMKFLTKQAGLAAVQFTTK